MMELQTTNTPTQEFISSMPFIIFFLLLTLIVGMFLGENVLYWFLLLVLFSMLIINSDKFASIFNKIKMV